MLQSALKDDGYGPIAVDGVFGPQTRVRELQEIWKEVYNIRVRGVVGPRTWKAIYPGRTDLGIVDIRRPNEIKVFLRDVNQWDVWFPPERR